MSNNLMVILQACAVILILSSSDCVSAEEAKFDKRGPLDGHAQHVQQVLDTLVLTPKQEDQLPKIVAVGHAAWRAWFQKNHEKVDAQTIAIRAARESGDKQQLKELQKEKKVFMHTAPSLLREPSPVRAALTDEQRQLFDQRLDELKRRLHQPAKK